MEKKYHYLVAYVISGKLKDKIDSVIIGTNSLIGESELGIIEKVIEADNGNRKKAKILSFSLLREETAGGEMIV